MADRPLRADARRNRDLLVAAAAVAFARDGSDATLNGIAREAGVGIGTLFRHFATREELLEAVYVTELAKLIDSAADLAATRPADIAVREWMEQFIDYMTARHGMADTLRVIAARADSRSTTVVQVSTAISTLMAAGATSGILRTDVAIADVQATLSGITLMTSRPEARDQAGRMLDLLVDGLRPR